MVNPNGRISCYEAVSELDAAMHDVLFRDQRYYLLGGISAGAIAHPTTKFDHYNRLIEPTADSAEFNIRDNGTKRDADVLVLDVLSEHQAELIKQAIAAAVGSRLVVSAFGVDRREDISPQDTWWTSRRTLDNRGTHRIQMHPLEQILPEESYIPWDMQLPEGGTVRTLNPVGVRFAYGFRSVSGLRPKDKDKVAAMQVRLQQEPEFISEIHEGSFKPWLDMAEAVRLMRWPLPGRMSRIRPLLSPGTTLADRAGFRARAIPLRQAERVPFIVKRFGQSEEMQAKLQKQTGFK
jgi:hypothetical protein